MHDRKLAYRTFNGFIDLGAVIEPKCDPRICNFFRLIRLFIGSLAAP
jgi:hypothetical protein